ncbi:MAG: transcriptional regulator [Thermomicrobiales bacterium]
MYTEQVNADYERARQKAFLHDVLSIMGRRSNELIPFHEVRSRLHPEQESYRGLQVVPVSQIVGSADRFRDFDREFLPRQGHTAGRWKAIDRAYYQDTRLPPIQLYKVGEIYFVKDGNHRVSVAKEKGVEFIDAEVMEGHIRVPLTASMTPLELLLQVEYANFLRRTNLDRLRPDHDIRPTSLGRYDELWEQIQQHRALMSRDRGREVPIDEAVTDWYDSIYLPIIRVTRESRVMRRFPGRTVTDMYLWIMARLGELIEEGQAPDPVAFAENYVAAVAPPNGLIGKIEGALRRAGHSAARLIRGPDMPQDGKPPRPTLSIEEPSEAP